ncbi:hypothetical protein K2173_018277 [Erythroxylum novogranatense]|uniref:Time for coffee n=1 Tax=Erythroxylum novogranatense TaxID=1862640 RepID=A0AAV8UDX2_9ROSI|nr:hypothetical protein K2173_018277 [Erythroxylum novogranatense]
MERNRNGRKSNVAGLVAANGLHKRQHRPTPLVDSPDEDGHVVELQETLRLRDRDTLSKNKRRRAAREEGEESTEQSISDEDDCEMLFQNNNHHRKSVAALPTGDGRQALPLKVADEMVVPRKARTVSVKRSHESWVSGNDGFGKEQSDKRASASQTNWSALASPMPSNSSSSRKKAKPSGPRTRLPKVSKSSSSLQDDIELEIAEVLYGLKKQSQSSKKEEYLDSAPEKLETKGTTIGVILDPKSSPTLNAAMTSLCTQYASLESDLVLGIASKKQKVEDDSPPVQNSSIASVNKDESQNLVRMEVQEPRLEKARGFDEELSKVSDDMGISKVVCRSPEPSEKKSNLETDKSQVAAKEKSNLPKVESGTCIKLDVVQDSAVAEVAVNVSDGESKREENLKIDLMDFRNIVENRERVETLMKKEVLGLELKGKKVKKIVEKHGPKLEFENPTHLSSNDQGIKSLFKDQPKATINKLEASAQSSSMPLPIAVAGCPSGLSPLEYVPPFQTVFSIDGTNGPSTSIQPPRFVLSKPQPKRCATHHYIASSVRLHQQCMKMNHFWPETGGSAPLYLGKPNNLEGIPPAENMIIGKPLQGRLEVVSLNTAQETGQSGGNYRALTSKDSNSDGVNILDIYQKKQLVIHQPPNPAVAGNFLPGPAFVFSLSQHQPSLPAIANQGRPSVSAASTNTLVPSSNAIAGVVTNSSGLPAVATATSFNHPNLAVNEAPYVTILPSNGCPFPISTPIGNTAAFSGVNPAQPMPVYSSFFPSQMLHPSQVQQRHPSSQSLTQPVHQNASTSTGSSSTPKQPQHHQTHGSHVNSKNVSNSSAHPQQPQKQQAPSHQLRKLEAEVSGESTPRNNDTRASHSQKSTHGQNFTVPLQPNFGLIPSTSFGGAVSSHGEKQQSQEKNLKGGLELIPSPAYAMSFASFGGSYTASNLNFSSIAHNSVILQGLPDLTQQGYQVLSAPQTIQKKSRQLSDGKSGGSSSKPDDVKKATLGKSSSNAAQTLVFDNSARAVNFVPSPLTGNWPSVPVTSIANAPVVANSSNSQQQHLVQLQRQHMHQQLQQQNKSVTSACLPSSTNGAKYANNSSLFSQAMAPCNTQWKSASRTSVSQPSVTHMSSKSIPQHSQISFGENSKSTLAPHVHQIPKSQQSDNSFAGNPQKPSAVCGRNVPSILSTCPAQLSELKY